jgi:hypothetical protein
MRPDHDDGRETAWAALTLLLAVALAAAHLAYASVVSWWLFRLADGIVEEGIWTRYGGIDWSWTNAAWLPAGLCLGWLGPVGLLLIPAGSLAAGGLTATAVTRLLARRARPLGPYGWRLWAALACWACWVPVPATMTLTYWHTVAY